MLRSRTLKNFFSHNDFIFFLHFKESLWLCAVWGTHCRDQVQRLLFYLRVEGALYLVEKSNSVKDMFQKMISTSVDAYKDGPYFRLMSSLKGHLFPTAWHYLSSSHPWKVRSLMCQHMINFLVNQTLRDQYMKIRKPMY